MCSTQQKVLAVVMMLMIGLRMTSCYPGGGPDSACKTLYPEGHDALPQISPSPYRIRLGKHSYAVGETIPVTLESLGGSGYFRGVYMQAHSASCGINSSLPIGVFTYPGLDLQTRHCFKAVHSTITHASREKKIARTVYWTAPVTSSGHVIFRVTFVKELHTFWINVLSETLRDLKDPDIPGCLTEKNTTTISSSTKPVEWTTPRERHFAHIHPASTYTSAADTKIHYITHKFILLFAICYYDIYFA